MVHHRVRGVIQALVTIYLWVNFPSIEKTILDFVGKEPDALNVFGWFLIPIVEFLLKNWEFISVLILVESVYGILTNRNFIPDAVREVDRLVTKLAKWLERYFS